MTWVVKQRTRMERYRLFPITLPSYHAGYSGVVSCGRQCGRLALNDSSHLEFCPLLVYPSPLHPSLIYCFKSAVAGKPKNELLEQHETRADSFWAFYVLCPIWESQATCGYCARKMWLVHTEMHCRRKIHRVRRRARGKKSLSNFHIHYMLRCQYFRYMELNKILKFI